MSLVIHEALSPNRNARALPVSMLILHYTGMVSGPAALARLRDPEAQVSAHYLVEEDGRIFALVPEEERAWHAGVSFWAAERDLNSASIGIEIVNPGHEWGYRDFPERQIEAVAALCSQVLARRAIPPDRILAHSDVAPARKIDPGERFPWARLAAAGVGLMPPSDLPPDPARPAARAWQALLDAYGYDVPRSGRFDTATITATGAFQRHFEPEIVLDGVLGLPTGLSAARLRWLCDAAGRA